MIEDSNPVVGEGVALVGGKKTPQKTIAVNGRKHEVGLTWICHEGMSQIQKLC